MGAHLLVTWLYEILMAAFCVIFFVRAVTHRQFNRQLLAAFVLLPFVLRLLLIK